MSGSGRRSFQAPSPLERVPLPVPPGADEDRPTFVGETRPAAPSPGAPDVDPPTRAGTGRRRVERAPRGGAPLGGDDDPPTRVAAVRRPATVSERAAAPAARVDVESPPVKVTAPAAPVEGMPSPENAAGLSVRVEASPTPVRTAGPIARVERPAPVARAEAPPPRVKPAAAGPAAVRVEGGPPVTAAPAAVRVEGMPPVTVVAPVARAEAESLPVAQAVADSVGPAPVRVTARPPPVVRDEERDTSALVPPGDVLVLGGGVLGAAIARYAFSQRARVTVGSRNARPHAGLWRRIDLRKPPAGLFSPGMRVFLAFAPDPGALSLWSEAMPVLVRHAWNMRVSAVTVCGPAGQGHPVIDAFAQGARQLDRRTVVVRLPVLFGAGDTLVSPLVAAVRDREVARVPAGMPPLWPLWVEDAARAVWRLGAADVRTHRAGAADLTLRGPERLHLEDVARSVAEALGGRAGRRLFGGREHLARLRAQENAQDDWDEDLLGERTRVGVWLGRLPRSRP